MSGNEQSLMGAAFPFQGSMHLSPSPMNPTYLWQPGAQWAGLGQSPGVQESAGLAIWQGCAER